nr:acyl carrier protein [uncultured Rhodopila sp.]
MSRSTDDVKNWMNMFRWIVKLIRDEFDVDEAILVRAAVLETDCGLIIEQVESVLGIIGESFHLSFPAGTLDEVLKLEELCMLAAWMKGLYKRPEFISGGFEARCRAANPACCS